MRINLAILGLVCALASGADVVCAQPGDTPQRKVIIVVADTGTWDEYLAAPFLGQWLRECAVGLMNARTAGPPTPLAAYLTLGASSRAAGNLDPKLAGLALDYNELYQGQAGHAVFYARTGMTVPQGALAYLGLPAAQRANAEAMYPLRLGLMGEALRQAGLKTAAIGNADLPHSYARQVVTIVMDETGFVSLGDVGPWMEAPAIGDEPRVTTSYQMVMQELRAALPAASVIAVETGDLSRISEQYELMTPAQVQQRRLAAILRMDEFLRRLVGLMRGQPWRLYVVAPSPRAGPEVCEAWLTPIAAWGEGISSGVLSSPSTRRQGIVANVDLAPTVLEFLGVAIPPEAVGRPMTASAAPGENVLGYVKRLQSGQERMEASRAYVIKRVSGLIVAIFVITASLLLLAAAVPRGITVGLREAALVAIAIPLAALVLPASAMPTSVVAFAGVLGIAAVLWAAGRALGRWAPPWAWLAGAFAAALCADIAGGQNLVQRSLLSYSTAIGARYYGLGNELGGALLAAAPLSIAGCLGARRLRRRGRVVVILVMVGVVIIIGHPTMGANLGIAVPAALGFGLMVPGLYQVRLRQRHLVAAAAGALVATIAVAAANWLIEGQGHSHIGRAVEAVRQGGIAEMAMVWSRKMAVNWLLVRHSIATWVSVSAISVLAGVTLGRSRPLSTEAGAESLLGTGLIAAGAASAAAFLLNDSGVLAAAWGLTLVAATAAYVTFDWRLRQET